MNVTLTVAWVFLFQLVFEVEFSCETTKIGLLCSYCDIEQRLVLAAVMMNLIPAHLGGSQNGSAC